MAYWTIDLDSSDILCKFELHIRQKPACKLCDRTNELADYGVQEKKMECFQYNDMSIYYKRVGKGKPVIFLHNGGNSHVIWERQISLLSDSHECFAFDLPGYGMSANPDVRYSLGLYTGFLDAFLVQSGMAHVTLVGHCIGSAISLRYAMEKTERVARIVLFNVLTKATVRAGMLGLLFKATAPFPGVRRFVRETFGDFTIPKIIGDYSINVQFGSRGEKSQALISQLQQVYRQKGQLGALADILADIESFDPLDHFEIPPGFPETMVIWGEENRILPYTAGKKLTNTLKPHRFVPIHGGGHLVMHELSDEINPILSGFIRGGQEATEVLPG